MNFLLEISVFGFAGSLVLKSLFAAFVAIIFLQSGFDKVLNYKGNLEYFKGQFSKSPLAGTTGLLLPAVTIMEVTAGILSAVGIVYLFLGNNTIAFYGLLTAAVNLLCLLFGQRVAKDYVGAAGIIPYFAVIVIGLVVFLL